MTISQAIIYFLPLILCLTIVLFSYKSPRFAKKIEVKKENELLSILVFSFVPVANIAILLIATAFFLSNTHFTIKKGKWLNKDHLK